MGLNEIRATLPSQKMPIKGLSDEVLGEAIIACARNISSRISDALTLSDMDSDARANLERWKIAFLSFRWAYPIKLKAIAPEKCDRTKPMITGPLFTSSEFLWPVKNDRFCEPIAQFYIDEVGDLAGENLGDGLFQLWVGPHFDDYTIRVIPRGSVTKSALTPVPSEIHTEYFEESKFYAGFDAWPEERCKTHEIVGIKDKVLHWDELINFAMDDVETWETMAPELLADVSAFTSIVPPRLPFTAPHFLGNFSIIQYDCSMVPKTLLALESKPAFMWGDCGNAQVFYSKIKGEAADFTFQWSCG